jgi:hypothetical protein
MAEERRREAQEGRRGEEPWRRRRRRREMRAREEMEASRAVGLGGAMEEELLLLLLLRPRPRFRLLLGFSVPLGFLIPAHLTSLKIGNMPHLRLGFRFAEMPRSTARGSMSGRFLLLLLRHHHLPWIMEMWSRRMAWRWCLLPASPGTVSMAMAAGEEPVLGFLVHVLL